MAKMSFEEWKLRREYDEYLKSQDEPSEAPAAEPEKQAEPEPAPALDPFHHMNRSTERADEENGGSPVSVPG